MERVIDGINTRKDGLWIIRGVKDIIQDYGRATMVDLKDVAGIDASFEDYSVSWDKDAFKNAVVDPDGAGYYAIYLLTDEEMAKRRKLNAIIIFI